MENQKASSPVRIWKSMLRAGVDKGHVIHQINLYLKDLQNISPSTEREKAIKEATEFKLKL